jgi:Fe-S oxidoreductase
VRGVYQLLQNRDVHSVITVDPHTHLMLKEVFPKFIADCAFQVRHYLDVLSESPLPASAPPAGLPRRLVMHDSCVMTRNLGIVEQARTVIDRLGIELAEPESTRLNTACCGGPVEYAYADLSARISGIRIQELAAICPDILVTCPICLINLSKYERRLGIRVWDLGEILYRAQVPVQAPK